MASRVHFEETVMDGEVHWLNLNDDFVRKVLCFPLSDCNVIAERLNGLRNDGFIYLLETGWRFKDMRIAGKGYAGLVVIARHKKHGIGALKIRRLDSRRDSLLREGYMMRSAQPSGLSPAVYIERDDYIFREYLLPSECIAFDRFIENALRDRRTSALTEALKHLVRRLHTLDKLGIDHGELNRPGDHILVCKDRFVLIDWESARKSVRPRNVTSVFSHLVFRSPHRKTIQEILKWRLDVVIDKLKQYKDTYDISVVEDLLCGLN
ncbi:MAG: serine/threonine protein kinase [Thermosphaera sp.]